MKGLFKSKSRTPVEVVQQMRELLLYVLSNTETRERKRAEKVYITTILFSSFCFDVMVKAAALFRGGNEWLKHVEFFLLV